MSGAAGAPPRAAPLGLPAPGSPRPAGARRLLSGRTGVLVAQVSVVAGFLVLWELAAATRAINPKLLGQPTAVVGRIAELLAGEPTYGRVTIYQHLLTTIGELVPGYAIGAVAGLLVGFVFARSAMVAAVFEPYILAIYSIPKIALAPVFILFFGIGAESKIAIVVVGVFFMIFFNTYAGVAGVSEEFVNLARIMGARPPAIMRRVIVPGAMPAILTGFKMAVPFAMIGAIVGEFIASFRGLGFFIKQATVLFDASGLMAGIFFLVVVTWTMSQVIGLAEARLLRWQPRRARAAEVLS